MGGSRGSIGPSPMGRVRLSLIRRIRIGEKAGHLHGVLRVQRGALNASDEGIDVNDGCFHQARWTTQGEVEMGQPKGHRLNLSTVIPLAFTCATVKGI
jgi:hypothetical protein